MLWTSNIFLLLSLSKEVLGSLVAFLEARTGNTGGLPEMTAIFESLEVIETMQWTFWVFKDYVIFLFVNQYLKKYWNWILTYFLSFALLFFSLYFLEDQFFQVGTILFRNSSGFRFCCVLWNIVRIALARSFLLVGLSFFLNFSQDHRLQFLRQADRVADG